MCSVLGFGFFLLSFSATDARAHLLLSCLFCEPSLAEPHGLDQRFVYCLEIKKKVPEKDRQKKKKKKDEMNSQRSEAGESARSCQH